MISRHFASSVAKLPVGKQFIKSVHAKTAELKGGLSISGINVGALKYPAMQGQLYRQVIPLLNVSVTVDTVVGAVLSAVLSADYDRPLQQRDHLPLQLP